MEQGAADDHGGDDHDGDDHDGDDHGGGGGDNILSAAPSTTRATRAIMVNCNHTL